MTTDSTALQQRRALTFQDWLTVLRLAGVIVVRVLLVAAAVVILAKVRSGNGLPLQVVFTFAALGCIYFGLGSGFRVWAMYIVGFIAFAQLRSYTDNLGTPVQYSYVITVEKALFFGTLPNNWLQDAFYSFRRLGVLEAYTMFVYLSYFFTPHILAFTLWRLDFPAFKRYAIAFIITLYVGLIASGIAPTAPPWLASQEGMIPQVFQIIPDISGEVAPGAYGQAYEVAGANPVAAMPSLHAAIPFVMMFALWKYPLVRPLGVIYALSMAFAIVYLGEHYAVDGLAGLSTAAFGWWAGGAALRWWDARSPRPAPAEARHPEESPSPGVALEGEAQAS